MSDLGYPGPVINLDAHDGDWIKRGRWDVDIPQDLPSLRAWLAASSMTVESFKELEVYKANVTRLPWLRDL